MIKLEFEVWYQVREYVGPLCRMQPAGAHHVGFEATREDTEHDSPVMSTRLLSLDTC